MQFMLGVDEAGRGPLAGPVAVGAVRTPYGFDVAREFRGVRDSKKLTEGKREELFEMLKNRASQGDIVFAVRFSEPALIDSSGITIAVKRAVISALRSIAPLPFDGEVLLDGALYAPSAYTQTTIIGGDDSQPIISLASIAAKVLRDRLMQKLGRTYPVYGFEKHKGYGTSLHREMIALHGLCDIHRRSYIHLSNLNQEV